MSELRDTPVKLFGWTITSSLSSSSSSSSPSLRPHMMNNQSSSDNIEQDNATSLQRSSDLKEESKETSENSGITTTTATTSEEKTTDLKKPDKILPCPRCNSANTKFCYYNNYNVSQPRHFCRNCQRYWTSGGTMRTVPVGSGRRKNKGWVSTDHYMHIKSENTNSYNDSSANMLSFESSGEESLVTEISKNQSSDSVSKDFNNFQRFLPPQVTSPVSLSPHWPCQYPPNPAFYHIPVYWGYTVPFWSTVEPSTCLGKRTRDEDSHENVRENKDTSVRARLDSQSQSNNDEANVATNSRVFYPVPMKREKTQQFSLVVNGSETKSSSNRFLQANPAAMSRSMNFRESL